MKIFLDTNILYYKYNYAAFALNISGQNIVSISALEFLKNIEKHHHNKAKYYIPKVNSLFNYALLTTQQKFLRKTHPFNKNITDSIIFDFKQDFESYALYNNEAITNLINNKYKEILYISVSFLEKQEYMDIKDKYNFLLKNEIKCESITSNDIFLAYSLLDLFLQEYSLKKDFRNSWNDILILAKTINEGGKLISSDKVLNRFASKIYAGEVKEEKGYIEIQFPSTTDETSQKIERMDSKGYINRGWQYKIQNTR